MSLPDFESAMPGLFDPLRLGSLDLPNRIVMAPMTRSRADDAGVPTDIVATVSDLIRAAGLNLWDVSMWFNRKK